MPIHKECKNFRWKDESGWCILKGINVNPNGSACNSFEKK